MEKRIKRIKFLCERMVSTENPEEVHTQALELQALIHEHIESLRMRIISSMGAPPHVIGRLR